MWTRWGKEGGTNWESSCDIAMLQCVKQPVRNCWTAPGTQLHALQGPRGVSEGRGVEGGSRRDICTHTAGSLCCTADINTTL